MLGKLIGFKWYAVVGVASLLAMWALWERGQHYANDADKFLQERNVATERANDLAQTLVDNNRQFKLQIEDLTAQREMLRGINDTLAMADSRARDTIKEIYDAPEEDDGLVAPVLLRTLERLWEPRSTGIDTPSPD